MAEGELVTKYSGVARWVWDIPAHLWQHCFQVGFDRYVLPRRGSPGWYVNHSCDPNCLIRGAREVVTRRPIRRGEELTIDYSTNVGWEGYSLSCACGARNCRRIVTSYGHLNAKLKREYGNKVSRFLLKG